MKQGLFTDVNAVIKEEIQSAFFISLSRSTLGGVVEFFILEKL